MTFLDNIRAIHNFYCINTNNLIEYSIFVENAQTMKKTFIFILWSLFSVAVNAQNFNDYPARPNRDGWRVGYCRLAVLWVQDTAGTVNLGYQHHHGDNRLPYA